MTQGPAVLPICSETTGWITHPCSGLPVALPGSPCIALVGDIPPMFPAAAHLPPGKFSVLPPSCPSCSAYMCASCLVLATSSFLLPFPVSSCYLTGCTEIASPLCCWHAEMSSRQGAALWFLPFLCPVGNEVPSKEHHELKPYVHHLHVIDNQQALFELSHRIEPRVWAYTASYNLVTAALWIKWMFMPSMLLPYTRTVYWVLSVAHTTCTGKSGRASKEAAHRAAGQAWCCPCSSPSRAVFFELKSLVSVKILFGPV